jgi:hypothetical protein
MVVGFHDCVSYRIMSFLSPIQGLSVVGYVYYYWTRLGVSALILAHSSLLAMLSGK